MPFNFSFIMNDNTVHVQTRYTNTLCIIIIQGQTLQNK